MAQTFGTNRCDECKQQTFEPTGEKRILVGKTFGGGDYLVEKFRCSDPSCAHEDWVKVGSLPSGGGAP